MYIIAGLGNPGPRYEFTRHNTGFLAVDYLAQKHRIKINRAKYKALVGEGMIGGEKVLLIKPQTYMNLSGNSVKDALDGNRISLQNLIVIYDDMDLEVGRIRIKPKGGAGTHNGMKSIIYQLETEEFPRIRIGIGECPHGIDAAEYVLGEFTPEEQEVIAKTLEKAANAVETIIVEGIGAAMNKYN